MTLAALTAIALLLALPPAILFVVNVRRYRPPPPAATNIDEPRVSVLIPARNEEGSLGSAIESVLASRGVELELIVLDDHSEDRTAEVIDDYAARDARVRRAVAPRLPAGWCGKQHACFELARRAAFPWLVFLDADVRLAPDALRRMVAFMEQTGAGLSSGFPRQQTGSLVERLVIPLIHFVLLGFLPIARMRASTHPAYGAGCGQLFIARREAYDAAGGHGAILASLHDGIALPRAFRRAGWATDLFDATDVASCRMYRSAVEVWQGLAKNATEGAASPRLIGPTTLLLVGGCVLPPLLGVYAVGVQAPLPILLATWLATVVAYLPRVVGAWRFRQSWLGAALHPVGVLLFVAIQWYALVRWQLGRPAQWKGRPYRTSTEPHPATGDEESCRVQKATGP